MNKTLMYENLLKLLRRGKWELDGDEILAFYQSFSFIIKELEESKKPKLASVPVVSPIQEEPLKKGKKKNGTNGKLPV